nr:hypothetical protein BaRGS_017188 [Batillaria attramentaria]
MCAIVLSVVTIIIISAYVVIETLCEDNGVEAIASRCQKWDEVFWGLAMLRLKKKRKDREEEVEDDAEDETGDGLGQGAALVADSQPSASEDIQVGCRELRAKRYISDGFCTSTKPIKEVVCAGHCLPIMDLPWYAEFVKVWARSKLRDWQCAEDVVKRKSVHLLCQNGQYRTYRIKVVKSYLFLLYVNLSRQEVHQAT